MTLRIQDPSSAGRDLKAALLSMAARSKGGGAFFAWANIPGIATFFKSVEFQRMITVHRYELYVGLDAITNEAAILELARLARVEPNLKVRAFWHTGKALYHPKMAWFRLAGGLALIVGSGNLTGGGLTNNWEAFVELHLTGADERAALAEIRSWLTSHRRNILPLDDPRVLARAKLNRPSERVFVHPKPAPAPLARRSVATREVLVADVPRASRRLSQVNFDRAHFLGFFGATLGGRTAVRFRRVNDDGSVGVVERRQGVNVASHNYRFEISALSGVAYPASGRPIGIYVATRPDEFFYMMLLPDNEHHSIVDAILANKCPTPPGRMRRCTFTQATLRAEWPESPLWDALS